jgi:hypothetical protein
MSVGKIGVYEGGTADSYEEFSCVCLATELKT